MKVVVFLCLLAAASAVPGPVKRIVNGSPAAISFHRHQASIQVQSGEGWYHICGGTIIDVNKILTAAQCLVGQTSSKMRVKVGVEDLNAAPNTDDQTVGVSSFYIHEDYNGSAPGFPNDLGVIYLNTSLVLGFNVQNANIPPDETFITGTRCIIAGWGQTSGNDAPSPKLQEAEIAQITTADCAARWPGQNINIKHICVFEAAASPGQRPSACMGDSGGSLMCGDFLELLAGVASWGECNCSGNFPSVYTRVFQYRAWIDAR